MASMSRGLPGSVRLPAEKSRFAANLMGRLQRPVLIAGSEARTVALSKSKFARLPQEPEDARLTGVTRSLHRRLLALNLYGSLEKTPVSAAKIA